MGDFEDKMLQAMKKEVEYSPEVKTAAQLMHDHLKDMDAKTEKMRNEFEESIFMMLKEFMAGLDQHGVPPEVAIRKAERVIRERVNYEKSKGTFKNMADFQYMAMIARIDTAVMRVKKERGIKCN